MKEKWYAHCEDDDKTKDYSFSSKEGYAGWSTDHGCAGYGFPKELAEWICKQLNESKEICPYTCTGYYWEKKK